MHACRKIALMLSFSMILSALLIFGVPRTISSATTEYAPVIGTKRVLMPESYRHDYLFESNTSLVFEASEKAGWTFDHMEIDFGCGVKGVRGSNVSSIFTIDNGAIKGCLEG